MKCKQNVMWWRKPLQITKEKKKFGAINETEKHQAFQGKKDK